MSYYVRAETPDGELLVGTEASEPDTEFLIERWALQPGDKIKLYDLTNPTRTVEVTDANDNPSGANATGTGDETDGQVRSDE